MLVDARNFTETRIYQTHIRLSGRPRSTELATCSGIQKGRAQACDSICSSTIALIQLELCDEFFHSALLLVHVVLKDLYLRLQAHVLLAVSVDLDLQLDGVFIELLFLLYVVTIWSLHFDLDRVRP